MKRLRRRLFGGGAGPRAVEERALLTDEPHLQTPPPSFYDFPTNQNGTHAAVPSPMSAPGSAQRARSDGDGPTTDLHDTSSITTEWEKPRRASCGGSADVTGCIPRLDIASLSAKEEEDKEPPRGGAISGLKGLWNSVVSPRRGRASPPPQSPMRDGPKRKKDKKKKKKGRTRRRSSVGDVAPLVRSQWENREVERDAVCPLIHMAGWREDMLAAASDDLYCPRVIRTNGLRAPRASSFTRFPPLPATPPPPPDAPAGHYRSSPLPLAGSSTAELSVSCYSSSDFSLHGEEEPEPEDSVEAARRPVDAMRGDSANIEACARKIVEYIYRATGNYLPAFRLTDGDTEPSHEGVNGQWGIRRTAAQRFATPPIAAFQRMGFVSYEHDEFHSAVVPVISVTESELFSLFVDEEEGMPEEDDDDGWEVPEHEGLRGFRPDRNLLRMKDHAINAIMDVGQRRSMMINPIYDADAVPDFVERPAEDRAFYMTVVYQATLLSGVVRLFPPRNRTAYLVMTLSAPHIVAYTRHGSRWERHPPILSE